MIRRKKEKEKEKTKENKKEKGRTSLVKKLIILLIIVISIFTGIYFLKRLDFKLSIGKSKIPNPEITFHTNMGSFTAELYPDKAPNTVRNIIALAKSGFYNNKIIYGKDVVTIHLGRLQDGRQQSPTLGDLYQNEEEIDKNMKYSIKGEFSANNFHNNDISHDRYVLSIARPNYTIFDKRLVTESYNSGCADILIVTQGGNYLNGYYSAFGKIIKGQDVIDKIEKLEVKDLKTMLEKTEKETDENKKEKMKKVLKEKMQSLNPFENQPVIERVDVDTKGIDYGMPKYIKAFSLEEYMVEKYGTDSSKTKIKRGR